MYLHILTVKERVIFYTCFKSPHFITKSVTLGYVVSKTPGFINDINSFQPEG